MKSTFFGKWFLAGSLSALTVNTLSTDLFAQPVVTYTVSGTSGDYTLDFTVNNRTPGTEGEDIYYFGILADVSVSGSPSGYNAEIFADIHYFYTYPLNTPYPFNTYWIDPTYTVLPTGMTLSGFTVLDTDATAPASVPYFAYGTGFNGEVDIYTGPGDVGNPDNANNPFFVGDAESVSVVPEPAMMALMGVGSLALLARRRSKV
jgi:hypothetical protein